MKLDDDVAKYLPKYADLRVISKFNDEDASYETRPAKRPITIRHLLTHTSGIGYGFSSPTLTKIMQKLQESEIAEFVLAMGSPQLVMCTDPTPAESAFLEDKLSEFNARAAHY